MAKKLCTNISFHFFEEYTSYASNQKDINKCIKILYDLYDQGYSVMDILDNYFLFIKTTNLIDETNKYKITNVNSNSNLYVYIPCQYEKMNDVEIVNMFINDFNKNIISKLKYYKYTEDRDREDTGTEKKLSIRDKKK